MFFNKKYDQIIERIGRFCDKFMSQAMVWKKSVNLYHSFLKWDEKSIIQ